MNFTEIVVDHEMYFLRIFFSITQFNWNTTIDLTLTIDNIKRNIRGS